jgi:beta-galactosidase
MYLIIEMTYKMKKKLRSKIRIITLIMCLLMMASTAIASNKLSPETVSSKSAARKMVEFNNDWFFHLGDVPGFEKSGFDHQKWQSVHLPHDYSIGQKRILEAPYRESVGYPGGVGCYLKILQLDKTDLGKKVYINFDGVWQNSRVWVNGILVGERPNGYVPFIYEISSHLKAGENSIAVRCDNTKFPNARWYTGSGIYRPVTLTVVDPIHIAPWGVFVIPEDVSSKQAKLRIQTTLVNTAANSVDITLKNRVIDPAGKIIIQDLISNATLAADTNNVVEQETVIENPNRWEPENPALYQLVSNVYHNGKLIDQTTTVFGVKSVVMDADKGLFLNDKNIKLKGVCNHHDAGPIGTAVPTDVLRRRMQILKDMGCNAVRTAHNIPSRDQITLADEMGLLIIDEAFDCWSEGKREFDYHLYFDEWWKRDITNMVKRDRNSPSVLMWSVGNEIPQKNKPDEGPKIARMLVDYIHSMDPSRKVTCGNNHVFAADAAGTSMEFDVVGYNSGGGSWLDYEEHHAKYPERLMYGSEVPHTFGIRGEYKTITRIRRKLADPDHAEPDLRHARRVLEIDDLTPKELFPEDLKGNSGYDNSYGYVNMRESWRRTRNLPYFMGEFRWTGFDYLGECGFNRSGTHGIIDICGFPKEGYYFYQSQWSEKPMVYILPHWNHPEKMLGTEIPVWAYSNAEEVELFLNGKSLGRKIMDSEKMYCDWMVSYAPGTLEAKAYRDGKLISTTKRITAATPAKMEVKVDRKSARANNQDVIHVEVGIYDENGNFHPKASNEVEFVISGAGKLIGTGNGSPESKYAFTGNKQAAFNGLCLALVQVSNNPGTITITVHSDNLPDVTVEIPVITKESK